MTTEHEVLHPKNWKPVLGYSNGMAARGRLVVTGGIIGWNADQVFETDDFAGQAAQVLRSIVEVLACAGARPEYLASLKELGRAYREVIGRHYPAMALVQVVALVEDRAKVEIEATAVVPD